MAQLREAVMDELGVQLPRSPQDGPVGRLIKLGHIVQYPALERVGAGTLRVYRAGGIDRVDLSVLMRLAKAAIDPEKKERPGRRGESLAARQVEFLSRAQYDKIRTMANHVASFLSPAAGQEEEAWAAVAGVHLAWDPGAGVEGDWRPFYELIDASRPPATRRAEYRSAAKTLLDLSATHGLLLRGSRTGAFLIPIAWIEVQERWTAAARHPGIAAVFAINHLLGTIAEVFGPTADLNALTQDDAESVVARLLDRMYADRTLSTSQKSSIRRAMRRLMDAGLVPKCDVNSWDYRTRNRAAAWSSGISKAVARAHGNRGKAAMESGAEMVKGKRRPAASVGVHADAPDLYAPWNEFPYPVLGDPSHPYSLVRCVDYFTAKGGERDRLGLRPMGTWVGESARGGLLGDYWREDTIRMRLGQLAMYIGWIKRCHPEIDLQSASLADLLTLELVEGFADAIEAGTWTTLQSGSGILNVIGLIASPCLEDEARKSGDADRQTQFFEVACLADGKGRRDEMGAWNGRSLTQRIAERDDVSTDRVSKQKAEAKAVERAYRTALGVDWAYDGMVQVYEAAKTRVLQKIGVESMAELRISWPSISVRPRELVDLRDLAIWNLSLAAPVRTKTHTLLDRSMLLDLNGRIDLDAPADIHKRPENGPYQVNLSGADSVEGFDSELMRLYLMPGGIRERLLNGAAGNGRRGRAAAAQTERLWVNSFAHGATKRPEVLRATVVKAAKSVIELAALELGLSTDAKEALIRVGKIHPFRHAVAGRLVDLGMIEKARLLLHHSKYDMILKVYAANGNASTSELRAQIRGLLTPKSRVASMLALMQKVTPEERAELLRELTQERDVRPG